MDKDRRLTESSTSPSESDRNEAEITPRSLRITLPSLDVEEEEVATPTSPSAAGVNVLASPQRSLLEAAVVLSGHPNVIQHPDVGPLTLFPFADGQCLCIVKPDTGAALSEHAKTTLSLSEVHHGHGPIFRIEPIPGKGDGMVAARNIESGTFVFREQPLLIACMDARFDASLPLTDLRPSRVASLLALHNSARGLLGMTELHGIVATNAVGIALPPGDDDHLAVCEFVSRVNHSCVPNARYYWDYKTFSVGLVATKYIRSGTEITITYVDPFLPYLDREAHLLSNYGFTCDCPACQRDSPTYALSEQIRITVNNVLPDADGDGDEDLVRWGGSTRAFVQRILSMLEVEGLQGERAEVIVRFAEFEQRLGHRDRAKKMAKWALKELAKLECEDASPDWAAMREILESSEGGT